MDDVVIETGAVDTSASILLNPAKSFENFVGYYLFKKQQVKTWADDLRYIQKQAGGAFVVEASGPG